MTLISSYLNDALFYDNSACQGHAMTSGLDSSLQCLIKNCGYIFADPGEGVPITRGRWLFPKELLATQGFPTYAWMYGFPDSSYSVPRHVVQRT
jgi:hypothetical protein